MIIDRYELSFSRSLLVYTSLDKHEKHVYTSLDKHEKTCLHPNYVNFNRQLHMRGRFS